MQVYTFGPGSLESITVKVGNRRAHSLARPITVAGEYVVYCGSGSEHVVSVNDTQLFHNVPGDLDDYALECVNYALEDWYDPCDNLEDAGDA